MFCYQHIRRLINLWLLQNFIFVFGEIHSFTLAARLFSLFVFPKFLKTHFFNKTVICILKSVELGMLKMSVNISAWNPPIIRVTNSCIRLSNTDRRAVQGELTMLFRRLDELINSMYDGFFLFFSSILIFYWVSLMFPNYINTLFDFHVCS